MAVALCSVTSDYAKILHKDLRIKTPPDEYGKMISLETIDVDKFSYPKEEILKTLSKYFSQDIARQNIELLERGTRICSF